MNQIPTTREELQELISIPDKMANTRLDSDEMFYKMYCEYVPLELRETALVTQIFEAMQTYNIHTSALLVNPFWYSRTLSRMQGTKHFCLWIPKFTSPNFSSEISKWIKALFPDQYKELNFNFDFYQNSKENQTIKHIEHFHVFIHLIPNTYVSKN